MRRLRDHQDLVMKLRQVRAIYTNEPSGRHGHLPSTLSIPHLRWNIVLPHMPIIAVCSLIQFLYCTQGSSLLHFTYFSRYLRSFEALILLDGKISKRCIDRECSPRISGGSNSTPVNVPSPVNAYNSRVSLETSRSRSCTTPVFLAAREIIVYKFSEGFQSSTPGKPLWYSGPNVWRRLPSSNPRG